MKYQAGQRVLFTSREVPGLPSNFHAASFGDSARVMHLNARDSSGKIIPITGKIVRVVFTDHQGDTTYLFQPDGWDDSFGYLGFQIGEAFLSPLADPNTYLPGKIVGLPLPSGYMRIS